MGSRSLQHQQPLLLSPFSSPNSSSPSQQMMRAEYDTSEEEEDEKESFHIGFPSSVLSSSDHRYDHRRHHPHKKIFLFSSSSRQDDDDNSEDDEIDDHDHDDGHLHSDSDPSSNEQEEEDQSTGGELYSDEEEENSGIKLDFNFVNSTKNHCTRTLENSTMTNNNIGSVATTPSSSSLKSILKRCREDGTQKGVMEEEKEIYDHSSIHFQFGLSPGGQPMPLKRNIKRLKMAQPTNHDCDEDNSSINNNYKHILMDDENIQDAIKHFKQVSELELERLRCSDGLDLKSAIDKLVFKIQESNINNIKLNHHQDSINNNNNNQSVTISSTSPSSVVVDNDHSHSVDYSTTTTTTSTTSTVVPPNYNTSKFTSTVKQDQDYLIHIGKYSEDDAKRILILKQELVQLRKNGYDHLSAITELSNRLTRNINNNNNNNNSQQKQQVKSIYKPCQHIQRLSPSCKQQRQQELPSSPLTPKKRLFDDEDDDDEEEEDDQDDNDININCIDVFRYKKRSKVNSNSYHFNSPSMMSSTTRTATSTLYKKQQHQHKSYKTVHFKPIFGKDEVEEEQETEDGNDENWVDDEDEEQFIEDTKFMSNDQRLPKPYNKNNNNNNIFYKPFSWSINSKN